MNHYDRLVTCFGHSEATAIARAIGLDALAVVVPFAEAGWMPGPDFADFLSEKLAERVAEADDYSDSDLSDERVPFSVTELGRAVALSDLEEVG